MKYIMTIIAVLTSCIFGYFVCGPEDIIAGTTLGVATIILMEVIELNLKNEEK